MGNTCKFSEIENLEIISESRKESLEKSNDDSKEFKEIKEIRKQIAMMNVFKRKDIYLIHIIFLQNNILYYYYIYSSKKLK